MKIGRCLSYIALCVICVFLAGCGKSEPQRVSSAAAQKLYLKSQRALAEGNYRQAYDDYQKSVSEDPNASNIGHLSSILYSWVISKSEAADVPLLKAQKRVWLQPEQLALRRGLLAAAVDKKKDLIHAFGLTIINKSVSNPEQRLRLAHEGAMADAMAWISRMAAWTTDGVEGQFDVSRTVVDIKTLKATPIEEAIYVVKVSAPVDCLR